MKNLLLLLLLFGGVLTSAQTVAFVEQSAAGAPALNFTDPVDVTGACDGSGRLFIVERAGTIKVFDQATKTVAPANFINLSGRVRAGGEQGLLGLTFHPNYATNGYFYVNYTANSSTGLATGTTVISRFTNPNPSGNVADAASELRLLTVNQFAGNHNAGDLAFGPDGYLYIPFGDGGGGGDPQDNGQDPTERLGKLLRIDVDNADPGLNFGIPADNPFVGSSDTLPEIWALGLRNPWRISFDLQTGDLWIADVGQNAREEINFQPASSAGGENYGWDCREGFIQHPGSRSVRCITGETYVQPVFDYVHPNFGASVTGGFVYRGNHADDLLGKYVFADYLSNEIFILGDPSVSPIQSSRQPIEDFGSVTTFGEDDNGNLFVMNLAGRLYEVTTEMALPVELASWRATPRAKSVLLEWSTLSENNASEYDLEKSLDGNRFTTIATLPATGSSFEPAEYSFTDHSVASGLSYYRLTQRDADGTKNTYAIRTVRFLQGSSTLMQVSPNPSDGEFKVNLSEEAAMGASIRVFSPDGRQLITRTIPQGRARQIDFNFSDRPAGLYRIEVKTDKFIQTGSLIIK